MKRIICVSLVFLSSFSYAGNFISNVLGDIDRSHYSSGGRQYHTLPSYSLRTKNVSVNPISITPPSLEVGCNGIDFVGGGLSFLDADQIAGVFKQLTDINTAIYIAYSLGMKMLSPELTGTIEAAQDIINKLNNLQLDACSIANGVVSIASDANSIDTMTRKAKEAAKSVGSFATSTWEKAKRDRTDNSPSAVQKRREEREKEMAKIMNAETAKFVANGGSLLEFLFNDWSEDIRDTAGGGVTFPAGVDVRELRALYGDIIIVGPDEDLYISIAPCEDTTLEDIKSAYPSRDNGTSSVCGSSGGKSIDIFVDEGLQILEKVYTLRNCGGVCNESKMVEFTSAVRTIPRTSRIIADTASVDDDMIYSVLGSLNPIAKNELAYKYATTYYIRLIVLLIEFENYLHSGGENTLLLRKLTEQFDKQVREKHRVIVEEFAPLEKARNEYFSKIEPLLAKEVTAIAGIYEGK